MPANRQTTPRKYNIITFLFAMLMLLAPPALAQGERMKVVASFSIVADFARVIGGERAEVVSLVGPDSDAHVYRATPANARRLKEARLVIINGLGFEGFMPRLIKSSGTAATIVTATSGVETLKADDDHDKGHGHGAGHGKIDPHAWQSIAAAKIYVANIRDGFIAADPAGKDGYVLRAQAYLAQLDALKGEIEAMLAAIPKDKRIAITSHDALAYFAREFGFTLEAVQGVSTEGEPSAKEVARIVRLAKAHKARAVFVENMTNPKIAERIAREAGATLGGKLFSDALSDEKGEAPSYIAMMRHNAKALRAALTP